MSVKQFSKLFSKRSVSVVINRSSSYTCTKENLMIDKQTRVIVQGFTGKEGTLHSKLCLEYGTNIVGGVNPKKGGTKHLNLPVFASVQEAKKCVDPHASIIFVPAPNAAKVMGLKFVNIEKEGFEKIWGRVHLVATFNCFLEKNTNEKPRYSH